MSRRITVKKLDQSYRSSLQSIKELTNEDSVNSFAKDRNDDMMNTSMNYLFSDDGEEASKLDHSI